jgi:hypothetical protein
MGAVIAMSSQPISSDHEFARNRLREWGRWNQERLSGYPICSWVIDFYGSRQRTPLAIPIEVEQIDGIVMRAEITDKLVLISWYVKRQGLGHIGRQMGINHQKTRRLLDSAEVYVSHELFS